MNILLGIIILLVVGYLYMLMPRLSKRKELEPFRGRYYAHRGLHDNASDAPENSYKAFTHAVSKGYGIELDVQLTKDEFVVVFHDDTLKRACAVEGRVSDYTYQELLEYKILESEESIPLFSEVLSMVNGQVPLIVEIKMADMNPRVCELVDQELQDYEGLYCVESFNPMAVRWYKKNRSNIIRGQLSSALNRENGSHNLTYFIVEHLLSNIITRPDFIAYNHLYKNNLGRRICKNIFRCFGVTWTIKSQKALDAAANDFEIFIFEQFIPRD